jgi:hypothetical protein
MENFFFQPIQDFNSSVSVSQLADSGFIILANKYNAGAYSKLIRTNKYGDSTWVKILEISQKVISTYDNCFVLSGLGSNSSFLLKLDSNGDSIWKVNYPFQSSCYVTSTNDSGYVLCGNNFVLKTDSLGNTIWTTPCIGNFNNQIIGYNDNILAVGGLNNSYVATLLDKNGVILWAKNYGTFNSSAVFPIKILNAV